VALSAVIRLGTSVATIRSEMLYRSLSGAGWATFGGALGSKERAAFDKRRPYIRISRLKSDQSACFNAKLGRQGREGREGRRRSNKGHVKNGPTPTLLGTWPRGRTRRDAESGTRGGCAPQTAPDGLKWLILCRAPPLPLLRRYMRLVTLDVTNTTRNLRRHDPLVCRRRNQSRLRGSRAAFAPSLDP
jgi:hypothetical protein